MVPEGKACIITFLIFFSFLVLGAPASANTVTIDNSSTIAAALLNVADDGTIILQRDMIYFESEIDLFRNVTIRADTSAGGTAENTIIDAQGSGSIFRSGSHSLTLDALALRNGAVTGNGGGILSGSGNVIITRSAFLNCSSTNFGGAVYSSSGNVRISSTTFADCSAKNMSGAIFFSDSDTGTLDIASTAFTGCSAQWGGALFAINNGYGNITVTGSSFDNCFAGSSGGAMYVYGSRSTSTTIASATITGCSANIGGAIYYYGNRTCATITSSTITGCSANTGGSIYYDGGSAGTMDVHFSRIYNNTAIIGPAVYRSDGMLDVTDNWWGTNGDPSAYISGTATYSPWLVLGAVADPSVINDTETSVIRANLTCNSDGGDLSGSGHVPDGIEAAFAVTGGSGSLSLSPGTTSGGTAATTFTPSAPGDATVSVTVDDETVSVPLVVLLALPAAGFSAGPLSGTAPLDVAFTDTSAGTITAWNWSFGDGEWFNTTDPGRANPVHTYSAPGVYTVGLTAANGRGGNTSSRADYIIVTSPSAGEVSTPTPGGGVSYSSGGGGGSNTDTGTGFATDLKTGSSASFTMDKGAVYLVSITAQNNVDKAMITVQKEISLPSSIPKPATGVYEYEDVNLYYIENSDLSVITFWFKVKKSWLAANGYGYDDIVMFHYNGDTGAWEDLPTILTGEDGTYDYYSAKTTSVSWFAIAIKEGATIVPESTPAPATQAVTGAGTVSSSGGVTAAGTGTAAPGLSGASGKLQSWYPVIMQMLFLVLAGIVVMGIFSRRKKEKYPEWWNKDFK